MRNLFLSFALFLSVLATSAQKKFAVYGIAFYNIENLFDTIPGDNDKEYTPNGPNKWNTMKYQSKLKNMAYAISQLGMDKSPIGPAVIGVAEVENRTVLEDLVKTGELAKRNLQVVHEDGPDYRGVDVGLLYNPKLFKYEGHQSRTLVDKEEPRFRTRDQLVVRGRIDGELFNIIVNHWPSRRGGEERSRPKRAIAAQLTKDIVDSIQRVTPESKIVIMGDLNDDPNNYSVKEVLDAKKYEKEVKPGGLFNPFWSIFDKGIGTLAYKGQWNLFDQIIISYNLLGKDRSSLKFWKAEVFSKDFLKTQEGTYKGYPKRTHAGGVWTNGYSDHFPTLIYLVKELQ
ncbi:MAG: endonuclease/exonuclease/phosphatase family protein [Bacteroidales bacterium]